MCLYVREMKRKKKKNRREEREREIKDCGRAGPCIKNEVGRPSLLSPSGSPLIIDPEENKLNPC